MSGIYRSFAKINLHLQVVGRRDDGYHELRTLFQSIDLHDLISVTAADAGVELVVAEGEAPSGDDNIAVRAARMFLDEFAPDQGARFELRKRIPMGGGLGGGSSNAATVLRALRDLHGRPDTLSELWPLARKLGADVPFFLVEGTAFGFGRGDEVVPLAELPEEPLWLAAPPLSVSTPEAFARLESLTAQSVASSMVSLLIGEEAASVASVAGRNDFEKMVLDWIPALRELYEALRAAGANIVRLSGTGATMIAIFDRQPRESDLRSQLPKGSLLVAARTLSRAAIAELRIVH